MRYRKTTVSIAVLLLVGTLFLGKFIRSEFIPLEDRSEFFIKVKTPLGSSLDLTDQSMRKIVQEIQHEPWFKTPSQPLAVTALINWPMYTVHIQ